MAGINIIIIIINNDNPHIWPRYKLKVWQNCRL